MNGSARDVVRDTITSYEDDKNAIVVSTFSSHIARVKTIAECAHEIGRKPVLLGRSMERYSSTAEQMKLVAFPETMSMFGNRRTVDRTLRRININCVTELRGIDAADGTLRVGAATRQCDLEFSADVRKHAPLIQAALAHVGHRPTRNRGTLGGSLCHLDPSAELVTAAAALEETLVA